MTDRRTVAALALAFSLAVPAALAQTSEQPQAETTAPSTDPLDNLPLGEVVDEESPLGTRYVASEHGDWQMTCVKSGTEADPCELTQLLQDPQGNSMAEISVFGLPAGRQAAAGVTFIGPLETLLTSQITMRVDGGQAKRYPFTFCTAIGCVAQFGLTEAEVNAFRRGNKAVLTIVPAAAPDQQVPLEVSLTGFTAGYTAVNEANAKAEAAAAAAGGD